MALWRADVTYARLAWLIAARDMIRRPGITLPDRLFRAGRRIPRRLVLELRVQLRSEQENIGGKIQPGDQDHDGRKRPVGLVVVAEVGDVEAKAEGQQATPPLQTPSRA